MLDGIKAKCAAIKDGTIHYSTQFKGFLGSLKDSGAEKMGQFADGAVSFKNSCVDKGGRLLGALARFVSNPSILKFGAFGILSALGISAIRDQEREVGVGEMITCGVILPAVGAYVVPAGYKMTKGVFNQFSRCRNYLKGSAPAHVDEADPDARERLNF